MIHTSEKMKILVTGFDPFGGEKINPSIETVKQLPEKIAGADIIKLEIPTVRYKSLKVIEEAILKYGPDVILSVGQAGGRADISVERIGINVDDFRIPDNEGNQPVDEPVVPGGPDAYFVTVPIKAMAERIREKKIPVSVSNTAGTFVCNHVIYGVCHLLATKYPGKRNGFIHIPFLPGQVLDKANMPSMSGELMVKALEAAIEAIAGTQEDIKAPGGTIH